MLPLHIAHNPPRKGERIMNDNLTKLTPELVSMAISSGMLDESLGAFEEVFRRRRELLAKEKAHALLPGTQFLATNITPKKLSGIEFRFLGWDGKWLRCEFVNSFERPANRARVQLFRELHVGTITKRVS